MAEGVLEDPLGRDLGRPVIKLGRFDLVMVPVIELGLGG
jgi:hypothetical protein